jgi:hypothetical protein
MLSGKTYKERDLSAFIRIVLGVCLDSADYHDTTIFVTDIDSDLHTYLDNINKNIQSNERNEPMRPLIESLEQLEKNGELNRERLLEVVGQSAIWDENTNTRLRGTQYCLTKQLTPETLQAIEVCISLLLEEEEKAMKRGNNGSVYPDCVYDGPLVVQHLRERLPKSVFDQLNEALKNRILELENKATARSDWGRTQPQNSGAPEGGDSEPGGAENSLVQHAIALNASQKKVICKTTTAVGLGTFGATVVATGIGAIAVWQTVAFVTLTAIATVCWPIAVAFSGAAVIATIVTYAILRSAALKQSRAEQATRSPARSLLRPMHHREKGKSFKAISKDLLAKRQKQSGGEGNQPTFS